MQDARRQFRLTSADSLHVPWHLEIMRALTFLRRPDVREAPVRLLLRRVALSLVSRLAPERLQLPRTFRLSNGLLITASLKDSVCKDLFVHGSFEWETLKAWEAAIPVGGTAIDVGAHIGTFTLTAAKKVGDQGSVLAFEPNPASRVLLEANVRQNGFEDRVRVLPYALLDCSVRLPLGTPTASNSGMARLGMGEELVTCRPLDDVVRELGYHAADVVKIDVEGSEAQVLDGAAELVRSCQPIIIMEVNGTEALDRLRDLGYVLRTPGGQPFLDAAQHQRPGESVNVLALPHPATSRG